MTQAGTARYLRGLLAGLREIAPAKVNVETLAWPVANLGYGQPLRAAKTLYREWIWTPLRARRLLRKGGYDILHSTSHLAFRVPPGMRRVQTLYDLAVLRHPERFRPWHRRTVAQSLRHVAEADCVLCISAFTADEAMALLSVPARKLKVVYCGSDLAPAAEGGEDATVQAPEEFFLFVGSLEPGKNLRLLKDVYRLAGQLGVHLPPLWIVGARWQGVKGEGPPPENWTYLGRQPDAVLASLYRRATALVFPSKYEGFGLPVLEAMSLGCPVICSRAASLPEVGGDAVRYSALDPRSFLDAMQTVSREPELRAELRDRGRERAKRFSWRRCAAETLAAYEEVLQ